MGLTDLNPLAGTMQVANLWLAEIKEKLGWKERGRALRALQAVLHALRDRLPREQAVAFGARLPTVVRGIYYEGWQPQQEPIAAGAKASFLEEVASAFDHRPAIDAAEITRVIFQILAEHVTLDDLLDPLLEGDLGDLWPVQPHGTFYFE